MKERKQKFRFILRTVLICVVVSIALLQPGCDGKRDRRTESTGDKSVLEFAGDIAITRLEAPAFESLASDDRIVAYYLSKAILAGRNISYDQLHPKHLESIDFLEDISLNIDYGAPDYIVNPFLEYLKLLWVHNGFYNLGTLRKVKSPITSRELDQLMYLALSNSGGQLGTVTDINFKRFWIVKHLFAQGVDTVLFSPDFPGHIEPDKDPVPNFYQNISTQEARQFQHQYPFNSRLCTQNDKIVELVYRAGDETWSAGPYAEQISAVIVHLERARPYLESNRVAVVDHLIDHFTTGDPGSYLKALEIQRERSASVDFILGFHDKRYDPLRLKGLWTGLLFISDKDAQEKVTTIKTLLPQMLERLPAALHEMFSCYNGEIIAAQLITGIGNTAPLCPDIYEDPPLKSDKGDDNRRIIFTNVVNARTNTLVEISDAMLISTEEVGIQAAQELAFVSTAISALLDYPDKEINPVQRGEKTYHRVVLENVLERIALFMLLLDEELPGSGLIEGTWTANDVFDLFCRSYVRLLKSSEQAYYLPEYLSVRLIGGYLHEALGTFVEEDLDGCYEQASIDSDLSNEALNNLAQQVVKLLSDGDDDEIDRFVMEYCTKPDPIIDEDRGRRQTERYLPYGEAFVLPQIRADFNPMGGIKSIFLEFPSTLSEQMYEFRDK
ncbi:hypothetical protein CEE37_14745 [candidate division LCP-89 bacterium B3_LCP]|uniref:DUF3160 domain-containing protein n=1 Tax=candidate division LCP-89 bacterium B3_LCP TaxID=2012998 RepID=A0A532UPI1_UNCL8|nr:MAG: hypothetical protein CEE37_14745 [candidate division LCP-89 bacterium B3_LCP]